MIVQELGKLKQSTIMYSIVLMAIGIMLQICPAKYTDSVIDIFGYGILITSAVMMMEFLAGKKEMMDYVSFTLALFLFIMGLCTIYFNDGIVRVLGVLFGILLIIDGLHSLVHALLYARKAGRKGWWLLIILSCALMLFAMIIFINPWWNTPDKLLKAIGVAIMFSAIVGLFRLFWIWPLKSSK